MFSSELRGKNKTLKTNGIMLYTRDRHMIKNKHEVLYDVPGGFSRGGHGHLELQQLIVALSGSFDITVDDGKVKRTFHLSRPNVGLYMPSGLWRELDNFSSGSICFVLASIDYDEKDYFRDYDKFTEWKFSK